MWDLLGTITWRQKDEGDTAPGLRELRDQWGDGHGKTVNGMEEAEFTHALVGARERPANRLMVQRRLERVHRGHDPSAEWKNRILCTSSVVGQNTQQILYARQMN